MAVSFLTKSIYLTNCNPILENPDHAQLFLVFFHTFFFFFKLKTHFLLSFSNQELTFILAFYRLVSINTSEISKTLAFLEHFRIAPNIIHL